MELWGKIAIVTGAACGIGEAISRRLALEHAVIALVDKSDAVYELADELRGRTNACVSGFRGDVTDPEFRRHVFDSISGYELVRVLIPCAGTRGNGFLIAEDKMTGKFVPYDEAQYDRVIAINQKAPTYWAAEMISRIAEHRSSTKSAAWRSLDEQEGVVVLFGSTVGDEGNLCQMAYGQTKAALDNLRMTLNKEVRQYGVFVTIVKPGLVDTPSVRAEPQEVLDKMIAKIPIGRLLRPDEIAEVVLEMLHDPLHNPVRRIDGGLNLGA